ncbi:MAG: alpha/beta hydrolase [Chloroflexi bacterium]|nr:alpha/beta hydrolase [Chloroflexota bacterium]MCA2001264.1 alpha/beta hydrolase [Chloroflexota bacterium]
MKKILKRAVMISLASLVIAAAAFVVWANDAYPPGDPALQALNSDALVEVKLEDGVYTFTPVEATPAVGFIFYPGGRVDYRAYAPVLRMIAESGYFVALAPAPLNLAFFDIEAAARVQERRPEIQTWAVGGHSLGGAMASVFAKNHPNQLEAVIFFASYPADDSLKKTNLKTLSIYGSNDMAGMETFEEKKLLLPADTRYVVIEGGNHAQFGSYGPQEGDKPAAISPEEQWAQAAAATVEFLKELHQ